MQAELTLHPASPASPAETVRVEVQRDGVLLGLRFIVEGEVDRIAWPEATTPARADDLWRRTCFEAFVRTGEGYAEFNLSPSGQWASYRFDGYRNGMRPADEAAVVLNLDGGSGHVALEARIELPHDADRLALAAVIEAQDGSISYWALAHPSDKPDFHHPDSFVLELP